MGRRWHAEQAAEWVGAAGHVEEEGREEREARLGHQRASMGRGKRARPEPRGWARMEEG